jgi:hypothetical protein
MTNTATALFAALLTIGTLGALCVADEPRGSMIGSTDWNEVCASDGLPGSAYSRRHRIKQRRPVSNHRVDHIVPLCLGGSDDDANIQIEPIEEAIAKDDLERRICVSVCAARKPSLAEAQAIFTSGEWRRLIRQEAHR